MIRHLTTWRAAALATALAGVFIGPQLPRELVILLPPVLVAGFVLGYASALREIAARRTSQ
jgi:hypothetical protein